MDVECGWPWSVHDSKIFANSSITKMLKNAKMSAILQTVIPSFEKIPN